MATSPTTYRSLAYNKEIMKIESKDLETCDVFHFRKGGAMHMVLDNNRVYVEYKQYSDGKTRIFYHPKKIIKANDFNEKLFEAKYFKP